MPRFLLTSRALADLKEIGRFTQMKWGIEQRRTYLSMFDGCFHQLAANPLLGKDCSDVRNGYRKHAAGSHIIFYRQHSQGVIEIVRILHGRMDVENRLSE